ncbi:hypothetical protein GQ568_01050 [Patescibacteria group bacterium]|nr:hypothetical protein [Patescibacteria group bacterium]
MLLRKKTYQISLAAIVFAVGSLFAVSAALAQTLPVDPNANNLIVNFTPDPLFNAGNFLPGDSRIGEAEVINGTNETKRIATEAINYPETLLIVPSDDLSRALIIVIKEKGGADLYGGSSSTGARTLFDFYKNGETYLSDIPANGTKEYEFIISFLESEGDEWQGKTTSFDIIVGFQEEGGGGIITPPSGGGGGAAPGLIIKNEKTITVGDVWVEIEWWTSYEATSRVIYCEASDVGCALNLSETSKDPVFDLPLYGYNYTTDEMHTPANSKGVAYRKITITGLISSTAYDFRCVSHASPPTISRAHTFTTLAMGGNMNDSDDDITDDVIDDASGFTAFQDYGTNSGDGTTGSTLEYGADDTEDKVNGAEDGVNNDSDSENTGLIPNISEAINSAGNFIGSVLESESADKTGGDAVNSGAARENKAKGSFESSYDQTLFSLIILLLLVIVLLRYVYRFRIRKKKYISDKDDVSS